MKSKGKAVADCHPNGLSNLNDYFTGNQKALTAFDYKKKHSFGQCVQCRSDYMKYAVCGICQICLQKAEFIQRENGRVLRKAQNQRRNRR